MKVLLVSEYFPPKIFGGGEISAGLLAKNLAESGLDVSVLTSHFKGLKEFEILDGVKIYRRLNTGENPNSFIENLKRKIKFPVSEKKELKKLETEEKFNVIHFLNTASITNYITNAKRIATINSYGNFCPKGNLFYKDREVCSGCNFFKYIPCLISSEYSGKLKLKFYLKYNPLFWFISYLNYKQRKNVLRSIDEFIVVSDFIGDLLVSGGIEKERIHKIPSIVDIGDSKEEYNIKRKGDEIFVTYIGNLEKIKGVSLLINAFNEIKIDGYKIKLLIIGKGPEREKLEKIADDNVEFLGDIDYKFMPSIYKQSDIIVLPSLWPEPLSRVLLEALYFGKPIIATNVGGNSEVVIDGENGFLVEPKIDEMKGKLEILIDNPKLRKQMGEESNYKSREKLYINGIIREIIKVYRGLTKKDWSKTKVDIYENPRDQ